MAAVKQDMCFRLFLIRYVEKPFSEYNSNHTYIKVYRVFPIVYTN